MAKTISAEGLALCAGCEYGTIEGSFAPYCTRNFAPYSSYCKHKPYGNTPYVRAQHEKIKLNEDLLVGMNVNDSLAIRMRDEIKVINHRLRLHGKMPKWRYQFIDQVKKEVSEENGNTKQI